MRIISTLIAICLTTTLAAQTAPAEVELMIARSAIKPYLSLAERYIAGEVDPVVAEIRTWTREKILRARRNLALVGIGLPPEPGRIDVSLVEAAVLFHTDAGLVAIEDGEVAAGQMQLMAASDLLATLVAARQLVAGHVQPRTIPYGVITSRAWHLSVIAILQGMTAIGQADTIATMALKLLPDDAELRLAAGSVKEELANELFRELALTPKPRDTQMPEHMRQIAIAEAERKTAREHYQRALDLEPKLNESRIRLGHVLLLEKRWDDARRQLEQALRAADTNRQLYLAQLFLGAVDEQQKRWADAVAAYRRTIAIDGRAQSARVALAHALENVGELDESRAVLEPVSRPVDYRPIEEDPWWMYPRGQYIGGQLLLDQLRARIVKPRTKGTVPPVPPPIQ